MRIRVAVLALVLLTACSNDKTVESAPVPTDASTTMTTQFVAHGYVDQGDYVNGRHIALVTEVDASKRTITVDVEQFLTGQAAIKAYKEDGGEQDAPDDDYYIRNQSSKLRTFTVATQPTIRLQSLGSTNGVAPSEPDKGRAVTFKDFAAYFIGDIRDAATHTLFWVTIENGIATHVEEQFTP